MTCPTIDPNDNSTEWQLYGAVPNADVPSGDVDDCRGILAITYDWDDLTRSGAAAWEYI
jgi:hypothetical protein